PSMVEVSIRLDALSQREGGVASLRVAFPPLPRRNHRSCPGPIPSPSPRHTVPQESPLRSLHIQLDGPRLRRQDVSRHASMEVPLATPRISTRLPFRGGSRNAADAQHAFG